MPRPSPSAEPRPAPVNAPRASVLERLGWATGRHPWRVIGIWVVLLVLFGAAGSQVSAKLTEGGSYDERADSWQAFVQLNRAFGSTIEDVQVIYSIPQPGAAGAPQSVTDPRVRTAVADVLARLPHDRVVTVVDGLTAPPALGMVSADGYAVRVAVTLR